MLRRSLAAALVAATVLTFPAAAGANQAGTDSTHVGSTEADNLRCWTVQVPGWQPPTINPANTVMVDWRATRVRQRARDLRWEVAVSTDIGSEPACVEAIPGSGIWVNPDDLYDVQAYLKARALAATNSVELYGEVVPWSYWVDVFARPVGFCESSGRWDLRDGLLQIIDSTWAEFGGLAYARHAGQATPAQQLEVGARVYDGQGEAAWSATLKCAGLA